MYNNYLNHYYLSNVQRAIALDTTREILSAAFFGKKKAECQSAQDEVENITTTSELDRVWLRHLNSQ